MKLTTALLAVALASGAAVSLAHGQQSADSVTPEAFTAELDKAMGEHSFFKAFEYSRVESFAPFVFYVVLPSKSEPGYDKGMAERFGPWCQKITEIFQRDYVVPYGFVDNGKLPLCPISVLATKGQYTDFADAIANEDLNSSRAHYNPKMRLVVTYYDRFNTKGPVHERRPALHEVVHVLQHRFGPADDRLIKAVWFTEGLAEYLSFHQTEDPEDLEQKRLDFAAIKEVGGLLLLPPARDTYLNPVEQLIGFKSYNEILLTAYARARREGVDFDPAVALSTVYRQSYLFVHFLHHGAEGVYRERFGRCMAQLLGGSDAKQAFASAFEGVPLASLNKEFLTYIEGFARKEYPDLPKGWMTKPIEAEALAAAAEEMPEFLDPSALCEELALEPAEAEISIGLAIARATRGDFEGAIELLVALREIPQSEPHGQRIDTELRRMRAWVAARDRCLQEALATRSVIELELDDKKIKGSVTALEDGVVSITGKTDSTKVPVRGLAPVALLKLIGGVATGADEWLRIYPYAQIGNPKTVRLTIQAREAQEETKALVRDYKEFYPRMLALGTSALALSDLAASDPSAGPAQAKSWIARLTSVWQSHSSQEFVKRRSGTLAQLAEIAYATAAKDKDLRELVKGAAESLGGERVRLKYEFENSAEIDDFIDDHDYLGGRRAQLANVLPAGPSMAYIEGGALHLGGEECKRLALEFEAPLTMSVKLRWDLEDESVGTLGLLSLGICADQFEHYVTCDGFSQLELEDEGVSRQNPLSSGRTVVQLGRNYSFELRHDGSKVTAWIDGQERGSIPAESRTSGSIFLWIHSPARAVLSELVIEGTVREGALELCRRRWAHDQVVALGLR